MYKSIIKTLYLTPLYDKKYGKIEKVRDDALLYLIGGNDGSRELKLMRKPKFTFYLAKENLKYHRFSVPIDKLQPITCPYSQRFLYMAKAVNLEYEYKQAKKDWKYKREWIQKNLYNHPQLYKADFDIEDEIKMMFNEKYGEHASDIEYTTSFSDIESRADLGDFNQIKAEVPICSIVHVDSKSETIYVNVLNDEKYPQIKETFNNLPKYLNHFKQFLKEIRKECVERTIKDNGDPSTIHSFNFNYKFFLFENEKDLIKHYFDIIKETKPDFCGFWNINYDMIMIKNRAAKLGLNMADLVSDDLIPPEYRYFKYIEDGERYRLKSGTHYSRFFDKILTTSSTQWYCQMSLHSNLRKRFLETDYKLDTIGEKYAYFRKVDLESKGYNIKDVYTKNFEVFLDYAIIDPLVQFMIERVNNDIPRQMVNCRDTNFFHGIRKTYTIKAELSTFLKNKNEIIGNNNSYDITENIPGAIIADPKNIVKKGINLLGTDTHIYRNSADLDIHSEYPSITMVYNILKTTLYGRIISIYIEKDIGNGNIFKIPISNGIDFNRMLQTIDSSIFDIGSKYFGLPKIDEIITLIETSCCKK